jgi:asparagine synthase (glutamine-hydrolysing)
MCGILGAATSRGERLSLDSAAMSAMRDLLAHRGPDAVGLAHEGHIALAHRRLTLLDAVGGLQPFHLAQPGIPRVVLAWNGEIYNHLELRRELERDGCVFRTRSDTETLAYLLAKRGRGGLASLRGMFAIAAWFPQTEQLLLARDSFGIVPLFHARMNIGSRTEIAFASEPSAILAHPGFRIEPDWASVASYLELPRRSFGARTLFHGLRMVEPGAVHEFNLASDELAETVTNFSAQLAHALPCDDREAAWIVRSAVTESIDAHLVADAPICTLLSGGIDSTVIASIARTRSKSLLTFAAGAATDTAQPGSDLFTARRVAKLLGSEHHEVLLDQDGFSAMWDELVGASCMPLSTPNEIAIAMLGTRIAPHAKAALSGEGADELFGGYGAPLDATIAWMDAGIEHTPETAASFYRTAFGWSPRTLVHEFFADNVSAPLREGNDDPIGALLTREYTEAGDLAVLGSHLTVQRKVNLTNLLERLNISLMRGSVEGRVPFADIAVLHAAQRVGTSHLFGSGSEGGIATATGTLVTKRVLRQAFADVLSPEIVARPKASFPLPFEKWIAGQAGWMDGPVSREIFSPAARGLVRTQAAQHWRLAWPMLNIARWLDGVFG